jgi:hypothetical protein
MLPMHEIEERIFPYPRHQLPLETRWVKYSSAFFTSDFDPMNTGVR